MSVAVAVISHLKADATVSGIVGTKVYRTIAAQGSPAPFITCQQTSPTELSRDQSGLNALTDASLDINCYATDPSKADTLGDAVASLLDGLHNVTIGTAPNQRFLVYSELLDPPDDFDGPRTGTGDGLYSVKQQWRVWHRAAA